MSQRSVARTLWAKLASHQDDFVDRQFHRLKAKLPVKLCQGTRARRLAQARDGEMRMKGTRFAFEVCGGTFVFEDLLKTREAAG